MSGSWLTGIKRWYQGQKEHANENACQTNLAYLGGSAGSVEVQMTQNGLTQGIQVET